MFDGRKMNRKEKQSIQNEPLLNERKSVLWVKYEIEYTKTLHQISFQRN